MSSTTMTAREAAEVLGVRRATLYTYVSRGWVRTVPDPGSRRRRRYLRDDVLRLKARGEARSGHGPVAAAALDWGEPVIDSAITRIDPVRGPRYRGLAAVDLALDPRWTFESVAEWLWQPSGASTPPVTTPWAAGERLDGPCLRHAIAGMEAMDVPVASRMTWLLAAAALDDPARFAAPSRAERARARRLLATLASRAMGVAAAGELAPGASVAERWLAAVSGPRCDDGVRRLVDAALILCADHELNASTFAARVAASTGADLYACLGAAVGALSGPLHGGACERVEVLLDEAVQGGDVAGVVHRRLARGESVPGFGQPLYPEGDPRARVLLEQIATLAGCLPARAEAGLRLVAVMAEAGHPPPTIDCALVVLAAALALPRGAALAMFALGRTAGWVAHTLEQRQHPGLLRPRARYTGP